MADFGVRVTPVFELENSGFAKFREELDKKLQEASKDAKLTIKNISFDGDAKNISGFVKGIQDALSKVDFSKALNLSDALKDTKSISGAQALKQELAEIVAMMNALQQNAMATSGKFETIRLDDTTKAQLTEIANDFSKIGDTLGGLKAQIADTFDLTKATADAEKLAQSYEKIRGALALVRDIAKAIQTDSKQTNASGADVTAQVTNLQKLEASLSKISSFKITKPFATDDESLERWNAELQKANELLETIKATSGEQQVEAVNSFREQITVLQSLRDQLSQVASFEKDLKGLTIANPEITFSGNEEAVKEYETAIERVRNAIIAFRETDAEGAVQAYANVVKEIDALKALESEYKSVAQSASSLEALQTKASNLANKIEVFSSKNTALPKETLNTLQQYIATLRSGGPIGAAALKEIEEEFNRISTQTKVAHTGGKTFFQTMKEGWSKFGGWTLVTRSFTKVISTFKQAVTAVKDVDAAMTELRKVTDLTTSGYEEFYNTATKMATSVGAKLSDTINAAADFSRLGLTIDEATKLTEAALVYKNVGDGIDSISDATESLISTMKAFGIEAADSMEIVDMFNEVGNNFAISSTGIGEALQRSASALATAGNTIQESIGLVVAANDVVQNPESVGEFLRPAA